MTFISPKRVRDFSAGFLSVRRGVSVMFLVVLLGFALTASSAFAAPPRTIAGNGSGAGQVTLPTGVAVNQASGDLYVADSGFSVSVNNRIDEFDAAGAFVRAFGWGVLDGANEFQTCTTSCQEGGGASFGSGAGQFIVPKSVAVDSSGGASSGDLYVTDQSNFRVQKFGSEGHFILMFGKEVNVTNVQLRQSEEAASEPVTVTPAEEDVCSAASGNACGAGTFGPGPGQLQNQEAPVVVDSSGDVWVGDVDRLEHFSADGVFLSEVSLLGAGVVQSLAVDSGGDLYVKSSELPGVRKLDAFGTPLATFDEAGSPNAVTVAPAGGDVFIEDGGALLAFTPSGVQVSSFGGGEIIGAPQGNALAVGTNSQIYVASSSSEASSAVQSFTIPPAGPGQHGGSLTAKEIHPTTVTLSAVLNPEGAETTYHFEYLTEAAYQHNLAEGEPAFTGATQTPPTKLPADFEAHEVTAPLTALTPSTAYRFRLLAENADGKGTATGFEVATVATQPPAEVLEEFAVEVTSTSVTLNAKLNPLGSATEYRFEYLTEAEYQANGETFAGAKLAPVPDAFLGAGEEPIAISEHLQGLAPGTLYRYRVFAHNAAGPEAAATQTFTTQAAGTSAGLLDGRHWEMVSPPGKEDAKIEPIEETGVIQAAAGGNAISYLANAPIEADPAGSSNKVQILSTRTAGGWDSQNIAVPHEETTGFSAAPGQEYRAFSPELSTSVVQPFGPFTKELSAAASEQTAYLHPLGATLTNGERSEPVPAGWPSTYQPLVTGCPEAGTACPPEVAAHANVPVGTLFGGTEPTCFVGFPTCSPRFMGGTPDLSHLVLESEVGLAKGLSGPGLYEWSGGELEFVGGIVHQNHAFQAVSDDGSRVVFNGASEGLEGLLVRDVARGETVQLGGVGSVFQFISADGSRVLYTNGGHLDECLLVLMGGTLECQVRDLTPAGDMVGRILGASSDGSWVYVASNDVLALGGTAGDCPEGLPPAPTSEVCGLYVIHDGVAGFVGVLSGNDAPDWQQILRGHTARVSPDGQWLVFMSQEPLTGYDNRDVASGELDEEVFEYHAGVGAGSVCASCDPTGARPHGIEYSDLDSYKGGIAGGEHVWRQDQWIAGNVPGWTAFELSFALYQSRFLSDSGRLFFDSSVGLVSGDVNGDEDVYELEPVRVGDGSCTSPHAAGYVASDHGCLGLVSSGTAAGESAFLDASESGGDVFFLTSGRLSKADVDTSRDVYDAHECTSASPCFPEAVSVPPPCTSGDACKPSASPQPSTFGAPSSSTFAGAGNLPPVPPPAAKPAAKPPTRAQKLSKALKQCRKQRHKKQRRTCETQARRRYGSKGKTTRTTRRSK
jgi:hypothetical protein